MECRNCKKEFDETDLENGLCKKCYHNRKRSIFPTIIFFVLITFFIIFYNSSSSSSPNSQISSKKPDKVELMSYAQTVLDKELNHPSYSSYKDDYIFVETNLRYKIEGNVTVNNANQKFWMIIEFTDNTYQKYDLISLQVGNNTIYKK